MSKYVSSESVKGLKDNLDIVDVIESYVPLKKRGTSFFGLCPFHQEATPSFSVKQDEGYYYCFGCQASGDAIKFIQEINKQDFVEAVLYLANKYNYPVAVQEHKLEGKQIDVAHNKTLHELMGLAAIHYQKQLHNSLYADYKEYLINQRKLSLETINDWQLGYASGTGELIKFLTNWHGYTMFELIECGLVYQDEFEKPIERFRDRIMFPIKDALGRVVGFGGRTINSRVSAKYLNSPETSLFKKHEILYGLDKAKKAIASENKVILVEGYLDVIRLHQAGIKNVVGTMGTAISKEQILGAVKFSQSKQVILNLDSDTAGVKAATNLSNPIVDLALSNQIDLRLILLPVGKDSDEYLNNHPVSDYQELIANASYWLWQKIETVIESNQINRYSELLGILSKLTNPIMQTEAITYAATLLAKNQPHNIKTYITKITNDLTKPVTKNNVEVANNLNNVSVVESIELLLLQIYKQYSQHRQYIDSQLNFQHILLTAPHQAIWEALRGNKEISLNELPKQYKVITVELIDNLLSRLVEHQGYVERLMRLKNFNN